MTLNNSYLESIKKQFLYYKTLGEKAMDQLEPEQLFVAVNDYTNSIATIVKHLSGNMLSRWTDFLTSDGEKEWRNRDSEFEETISTKEELLITWNKGWDCFFNAIDSLTPDQLTTIIYIRNEGHTVIEAINRQLAHYPYHIGQMVFYAKMLIQSEWTSLSIPKNKSNSYNADKFAKEKSIKNFTDDELNKHQNKIPKFNPIFSMKFNIQYTIYTILILALLTSCQQQECNPKEFKTGTFRFEQVVNGKKEITLFTRTENLQIETYHERTDTASVRWVNDYEFILQKLKPRNRAEKKAISMRILSTKGKSYTFEYSFVGESKKQMGTVTKTN